MNQKAMRNRGLSLFFLAAALTAQAGVARLPAGTVRAPAGRDAAAAAAPGYSFTLLDYPGSFSNFSVGINPGANRFDAQIVGAYQFVGSSTLQTGFLLNVLGLGGVVSEIYQEVDDPAGPAPQQAYSINDSGQIVGDYIDSAGIFHSYLRSGGRFIPIEVPFAGAAGTWDPQINNSGVIIGSWFDSAGNIHAYQLIDGKFTSFDYPGAAQTLTTGINSAGHIVGEWLDAGGAYHGFLLIGGRFSSFDYPGAVGTFPGNLNDADQVVGAFCPTTACTTSGIGAQGFVLSGGVYTTVNVPGEAATSLNSISNFGLIAGDYIDGAGYQHTFLATPAAASQ